MGLQAVVHGHGNKILQMNFMYCDDTAWLLYKFDHLPIMFSTYTLDVLAFMTQRLDVKLTNLVSKAIK